jgi:hypothetical protein
VGLKMLLKYSSERMVVTRKSGYSGFVGSYEEALDILN